MICVLGMHRSGTSALTGVVEQLGAFLGPPAHLMAPRADNPAGFFEHQPLTDLNDFPMPFRIEVDEAARRIADGMARQDPEIHFPKRFSIPFKLLAMLPAGLYNRVAARLVRAS